MWICFLKFPNNTSQKYLPTKNILQITEKPLEVKSDVGKVKLKIPRWIHHFQSSVQFSQVYVSENWYKGGNSNLNLVSDQQYSINLNDLSKKLLFENSVQWRLNINNAPDEDSRSIRINEDLFQINSTFGVKAFNKWYYTTSLYYKTQIFNNFKVNTDERITEPFSPSEFNMGVGMTYQHKDESKSWKLRYRCHLFRITCFSSKNIPKSSDRTGTNRI